MRAVERALALAYALALAVVAADVWLWRAG